MSETIRPEGTTPMSDQPNEPGSANPPEPVPEVTAARPNTRLGDLAGGHDEDPTVGHPTVFDLERVSVSYGGKTAIRDVDMDIHCNLVTAFIGPSGCGKTTLLRTLNRLNDLIPGAAVDGKVNYRGEDLYGDDIDAVEVRRG